MLKIKYFKRIVGHQLKGWFYYNEDIKYLMTRIYYIFDLFF